MVATSNNRHKKKVSLRQPESTAAVRHQCMNPLKVAKYFYALQGVIKDLQPHQIWNMDETGLQLDLKAKKIVAAKGSRYLHMRTSGNREMITIIGCVNAAGKALPPHIILKGKTTKALNGFQTQDAPEGAMWTPSDSGWTKQGIAKLWFENTFLKNIGPDRPQLLILDGHDSHNFMELIDLAISNNIEIVELPAHTSNWLQPCDCTVFKSFKDGYNNAAQEMMSNHPGVITNKANFAGLLNKAWIKAMTESNIKSGFKSCGIYPFNSVPSEAYLSNYLYSVDTLVKNPELLDQTEVVVYSESSKIVDDDDSNRVAIDTAMEADEVLPNLTEISDTVIQTESNGHNLVTESVLELGNTSKLVEDNTVFCHFFEDIDVSLNMSTCEDLATITPDLPLTNITNFEDFVVQDQESPSEIPHGTLELMETALGEQQLNCYQYCFSKGYDLADPLYATWRTLKVSESKLSATTIASSDSDMGIKELVLISNSSAAVSDSILDLNIQMEGEKEESNNTNILDLQASSIIQTSLIGDVNPIFPFKNTSFPGDGDDDILEYPVPAMKKTNKTRSTEKYFVLTSKEAFEMKVKQTQEKIEKENEKEQHKLKRQQNLKIKQAKIAKEKEDKAKRTTNGSVLKLNKLRTKTKKSGRNLVKLSYKWHHCAEIIQKIFQM